MKIERAWNKRCELGAWDEKGNELGVWDIRGSELGAWELSSLTWKFVNRHKGHMKIRTPRKRKVSYEQS
jgi:hypothetical protein